MLDVLRVWRSQLEADCLIPTSGSVPRLWRAGKLELRPFSLALRSSWHPLHVRLVSVCEGLTRLVRDKDEYNSGGGWEGCTHVGVCEWREGCEEVPVAFENTHLGHRS